MFASRITRTIGRAFIAAGTSYIRATRPDILVYSSEEYRYTRWLQKHSPDGESGGFADVLEAREYLAANYGPSRGLQCWRVDVSRAAQEYGLRRVPDVKPDLDPYSEQRYFAGFRLEDWAIHTGAGFLDRDLTDDYSQARFTSAGAPNLDNLDAHKFVIAHELWHARQHELYGPDEMFRWKLAEMLGLVDHDAEPTELQADLKAAETYKLVDIIPWQDRRESFERDQSDAHEREELIRAYLQARLSGDAWTSDHETLEHVIQDIADLSTQALVKRATHQDQSRVPFGSHNWPRRNATLDRAEVQDIPPHPDSWYEPGLGWVTTNLERPC